MLTKLNKLSKSQVRGITIFNPANGSKIKELEDDTPQTVASKFQRAKAAQKALHAMPLEHKIEIMNKFGESLTKNAKQLGEIMTSETGKPHRFAVGEINATSDRVKFFVSHVKEALADKVVKVDGTMTETIKREPLGVIANISAWNYPYFVGSNVYVPALLTGNTVLYKPSEYASLSGLKMAELLYDAGVPKDAFIPIIGGGSIGNELLKQPINGVFFTGSYATGVKINQAVASKLLPKVQLELGGKCPAYIHYDVDVKAAAEATSDGAFFNNGQSCCAVERIYVHEKIYDNFVKEFVESVKSFKMGDPMGDGVYFGPLTRPQQAQVLKEQIADAVSKGAKLLLGGTQKEGGSEHSVYFNPTVLVNVNHNMQVMREESFGPIIGIQKVSSPEEAISLMNDSLYGLTASVYTKDQKVADSVLTQMDSGTAYWNCCDRVSPFLPWSGRKQSGVGLTLSVEGITTFTQPKGYHKRSPQ
eukprot:TRINITY_DN9559_c0_g1_i1.p1 TRINITY_DN9559_c0_g1~~TRINITY_DN9559_c0_g1_i1.p1  ORF type:complete len:475 (-),score=129.33 TRINITY_DN9559_c0_g1_i1:30-1454(-)